MGAEITPVESKQDLNRFIKCQWDFYKNSPYWVPPIIAERKQLLDEKKNPFFDHSEIKHFLAEENGRITGRISAIVNGNHLKTYNDDTGFFGFFECIDSQDTANALFSAAADWLRGKGLKYMRGPANPSMNDEVGLLIEGFDSPPVVLMPYNPEYYIDLVENAGFYKKQNLFAYLLIQDKYKSDKLLRMQNIIRERYKITIREVDFKNKAQFKKDVDTLKHIYNSAWEANWGFVKMTDAEFNHLAAGLKQIAEKKLAYIAESKGEPMGFALGLPDVHQSLIHNKKGSLLGAIWHILTKKKKIDMMRIIVLGVLPEYQKTGVDAVMFYEMGARGHELGIDKGEASFILEDNVAMNRAATKTMKGDLYKRYRIYEKQI